MEKISWLAMRAFAFALIAILALLPFSGNAYASSESSPLRVPGGQIVVNHSPLFEKRFDYGDNPVHYSYRVGYGWDTLSHSSLYAQSWMWVKNTNRTVGSGAIMSQAGLTLKDHLFFVTDVIYGPSNWLDGDNPPGVAVESFVETNQLSGRSAYAWGNGFVRDPLSEYHHCETGEYFAIEVA